MKSLPHPQFPVDHTVPRLGSIATRDALIGTLIAIGMGIGFWQASHGWSLIVTFVPGAIAAWLLFLWCYRRRAAVPTVEAFLPLFCCVLAVQFIHFFEEYATGFANQFAVLYGGSAYPTTLFVGFNMGAYAVMTVCCVLALTTRMRFLLVPAMFFVVYGAIGNAIAHTWWVIQLGQYFPGFYTAQLHWIGGPWLLNKIVGDPRLTAAAVAGFAAALIPILAVMADTAAVCPR